MSSSDNPQYESQAPLSAEPPAKPPTAPDSFPQPPSISATVPAVPVEDPPWDGWDVLLIAALTFVVVILLQLALAKVAQQFWYPGLSVLDAAQKVGNRPILLIILQFLIYVPVAFFMIASVEGKYHVPFWQSIQWNWPRSAWKLVAVGAALLLALSTLEALLPMPKETPFERLFDRPLDAYLLAVLAITLGPLMEELFFRGLLYPVLARRIGTAWAIVLSAVPFALLHLPQYGYAWAAALVIFVVGLVCGIVRAVTRSVAASFLVHVGYNGAQMLIAMVLTHGFTHMPKSFLEYYLISIAVVTIP